MVKKWLVILVGVGLLAACGSGPKGVSKSSGRYSVKRYAYYDKNNPANQDSIEDLIYSELSKRQQSLIKKYSVPNSIHSLRGVKFDIPMTMNDRVQNWIDYFANGSGRKHFARYLSRSTRFVPTQLRILKENNMPKDIIFLSMIESGYNTQAYSSAAATGLWQFIRSTGRLYGLESDYWVDERRDPEKASLAATRHLKDLYQEFGDWYLAFAAYNAGAGKVRRAIEATGSRSFWDLAASPYLRQETKDYVPKILAAAIVSKSPEKYGFNDVEYQDPIATEKVTVTTPTDLEVVAECAGVDVDLIRLINPELIRGTTPPNHGRYTLYTPRGTARTFETRYARLDLQERTRSVKYVAQRGDTLRRVAEDHGVTLASLLKANPSLATRRRIPEGVTLIVPKGLRGFDSLPSMSVASHYPTTSSGKKLTDLILDKDEETKGKKKSDKKKKEPKIEVAQASPNLIKEENELKVSWKEDEKSDSEKSLSDLPATAQAKPQTDLSSLGDESLDTHPLPSQASQASGDVHPETIDEKIQQALSQVEPGTGGQEKDAVEESIREGRGVRIKPSGEEGAFISSKAVPSKARAPEKSVREKVVAYRVKRGENLTEIAQRYHVSLSDLREWNHLKAGRALFVNQKLTIHTPSTPKSEAPSFARSTQKDRSSHLKKPEIIAYKVRRGDTLIKIAKKYDLKPSTILDYNRLGKRSPLRPGLVLKIPTKVNGRG